MCTQNNLEIGKRLANLGFFDYINSLTVDDIAYIQILLQKIKENKNIKSSRVEEFKDPTGKFLKSNRATEIYDPLNRGNPVDWRVYHKNIDENNNEPDARGGYGTRKGKKSQFDYAPDKNYYNPYEYGIRQNCLSQPHIEEFNYHGDPNTGLKDVNVESCLIQREMTHYPGQRGSNIAETDRFQLLPFDPQDHKHIVWSDNMPRGGYATRKEKYMYE